MKIPLFRVVMLLCFLLSPLAAQSAYSLENNLLLDPGFEASTPNGTFPDSGFWKDSHAPIEAGAVCTTTAKKDGAAGLWICPARLSRLNLH